MPFEAGWVKTGLKSECWQGWEASSLDREQMIVPWAPGSKPQIFGPRASEQPRLVLLAAGPRVLANLNQQRKGRKSGRSKSAAPQLSLVC